jgi:hypothetical protein
MKPSEDQDKKLARLIRRKKQYGITLAAIAAEAGDVRITTVCHVLAGRTVSANIVNALKRLIAERQEA